ncbi:MAG: hypothetical protein IKS70_01915 [Bacteroides sp.]|nr:hypothetical protein [Bacteroides sp.]
MNMKRNILLLLSLVFTTLFVSCTDAKDDEKAFNIVGTKWEMTYRFILNDPNSALVSVIYDFSTPTEVTFRYTIKEGEIDPQYKSLLETKKLSYTYTKPMLKISFPNGFGKTVYKVDEEAGTMSIVGKEILDEKGNWVLEPDGENEIYRLQK